MDQDDHDKHDDDEARRAAAVELWGRLRALEEEMKATQLAVFAAMAAAVTAGADPERLTSLLRDYAQDRTRKGESAGRAVLDRLIDGLATATAPRRDDPADRPS